MKKSKFTEEQIGFGLRQAELGISVDEVCRKMGISEATFYNWKKKYGGLGVNELRRLRQLEDVFALSGPERVVQAFSSVRAEAGAPQAARVAAAVSSICRIAAPHQRSR